MQYVRPSVSQSVNNCARARARVGIPIKRNVKTERNDDDRRGGAAGPDKGADATRRGRFEGETRQLRFALRGILWPAGSSLGFGQRFNLTIAEL